MSLVYPRSIDLPTLGVVAIKTLVKVALGVFRTGVHWVGFRHSAHALKASGGGSSSHGCVGCRIFLLAFPE